MLIVFPIFAAVDETTMQFEILQDKISRTPADQRKSHAQAAEKIFLDYKSALISILDRRPKVANSNAHPDFLKALDRNTGNLLCKLIGFNAVGLITSAKGDVNNALCEVYKLKGRAFNAGLNQPSVRCLPANTDQLIKPLGCQ